MDRSFRLALLRVIAHLIDAVESVRRSYSLDAMTLTRRLLPAVSASGVIPEPGTTTWILVLRHKGADTVVDLALHHGARVADPNFL